MASESLITKLYFAIFAAFKESMTLNLAQRSFKVIDFGTNRKRVYIFLLLAGAAYRPVSGRCEEPVGAGCDLTGLAAQFSDGKRVRDVYTRYTLYKPTRSDGGISVFIPPPPNQPK